MRTLTINVLDAAGGLIYSGEMTSDELRSNAQGRSTIASGLVDTAYQLVRGTWLDADRISSLMAQAPMLTLQWAKDALTASIRYVTLDSSRQCVLSQHSSLAEAERLASALDEADTAQSAGEAGKAGKGGKGTSIVDLAAYVAAAPISAV